MSNTVETVTCPIACAFSPCPNDTFIFDAWVHNKIPSTLSPKPVLADIQQLNLWALDAKYPVTKISTYCLGNVTDQYAMIPTGAAIQDKGGPLLIAREPFKAHEITNKTVAVPGLDTTAYLLLRTLFDSPKKIVPARYDEIIDLVRNGHVDAGVLIHESRFIFDRYNLTKIADLGILFAERFSCPIPLGVIVVKRAIGDSLILEVTRSIQESINYAKHNPQSPLSYVLEHSREKEINIVQKHIETYVTEETKKVSLQGLQAIRILFEMAIEKKLLPQSALNFFFSSLWS